MKNFWDKFKDMTAPYAAEDDYDDEYDDELDDGFAEEESASRFPSHDSRRARRAPAKREEPAFPAEENAEALPATSFTSGSSISTGFSGHVVGTGISTAKQQLVLVHPESFKDASTIARNLREKKAVVLNLENVDKHLALRMVDFLSGCTFAVDGDVKKVSSATYVFCPSNMEISGDLKILSGETDVYV